MMGRNRPIRVRPCAERTYDSDRAAEIVRVLTKSVEGKRSGQTASRLVPGARHMLLSPLRRLANRCFWCSATQGSRRVARAQSCLTARPAQHKRGMSQPGRAPAACDVSHCTCGCRHFGVVYTRPASTVGMLRHPGTGPPRRPSPTGTACAAVKPRQACPARVAGGHGAVHVGKRHGSKLNEVSCRPNPCQGGRRTRRRSREQAAWQQTELSLVSPEPLCPSRLYFTATVSCPQNLRIESAVGGFKGAAPWVTAKRVRPGWREPGPSERRGST